MFIYALYPVFYDWAWGDKIIDNHIINELNNQTDYRIVVPLMLSWLKNNVDYPTNETEFLTLDNSWGLHKINGEFRFFHRGVPASWLIKSKLGRCGEDAVYFVEVMRKLGYTSRQIKPDGWDHSWAEFYTPDGIKVLVDPSAHRVITEQPSVFASNANWTTIWAINDNGSLENISQEYL